MTNKLLSKAYDSGAWIYCFKKGDKAVFLDRRDRVIKEFDTYAEAVEFADKNIHLINRKKV